MAVAQPNGFEIDLARNTILGSAAGFFVIILKFIFTSIFEIKIHEKNCFSKADYYSWPVMFWLKIPHHNLGKSRKYFQSIFYYSVFNIKKSFSVNFSHFNLSRIQNCLFDRGWRLNRNFILVLLSYQPQDMSFWVKIYIFKMQILPYPVKIRFRKISENQENLGSRSQDFSLISGFHLISCQVSRG